MVVRPPTTRVWPAATPRSALTIWSWSTEASAPAPDTTPPEPASALLSMLSLPLALTCRLPPTLPRTPVALTPTVLLLTALDTATPTPTKPTPTPKALASTAIESVADRVTSPVVPSVTPAPRLTRARPLLVDVAPAPVAPSSRAPAPAVAWLLTVEAPAPSTAATFTLAPRKFTGPAAFTSTAVDTVDNATDTPTAAPAPTATPRASVLAPGLDRAARLRAPDPASSTVPLASVSDTVPLSVAVAPAPEPATTPAEPPLAKASTDALRSATAVRPWPMWVPLRLVPTLPLWLAVAVTTPTDKAPAVAP